MEQEIKIEAGQIWRQRNGKLIPIESLEESNGSTFIKSGSFYWQGNGKYWSDEFEHSKDLIEKIS